MMRDILLVGALCGWGLLLEAAEVQGRLVWTQVADLGVAHAGVVTEVPVTVGQKVSKGTLLLALDPKRFQARKEAAKAQLKAAQLALEEALREEERAKELYDRAQTSEHEHQLAAVAAAQAKAVHARAEADWLDAQLALKESRLLAPFSGHIVSMTAYLGQQLKNRCQVRTLVRLANRQRVGLHLTASKTIQGLKPEQSVKLETKGQSMDVQIKAIRWLDKDQVELDLLLPEGARVTAGTPVSLVWQ
jgi:RND family efflux transporter MFP subunit